VLLEFSALKGIFCDSIMIKEIIMINIGFICVKVAINTCYKESTKYFSILNINIEKYK